MKQDLSAYMKKSGLGIYPIIGMSPGNSYFKDEIVRYLLKTIIDQFGHAGVLIPDIPAISTYIALGYSENRARRDKAMPKGNALKNRVLRVMEILGYASDTVRIFDWKNEIADNVEYKRHYEKILDLYKNNTEFFRSVNSATQEVLRGQKKALLDIKKSTDIAAHYLLSEIAFLEFAPSYLDSGKVVYVYHKNWKVYEDYIAGKFDGIVKSHLEFLIIRK